ncbi:hypothetical protein B0A49_11244 [Cryomyces minteri]|uniref:Uncharacterized protein n=1 Tax=Cryomyces minteri TaxID=331657 RepID=A0A4U0W8V1_9PEZI|nr:hypothetical protein B0A49_11244 [Cryomyces minteri]
MLSFRSFDVDYLTHIFRFPRLPPESEQAVVLTFPFRARANGNLRFPVVLTMSKVLKSFGDWFLRTGAYKKLFKVQAPGNRIAPPKTDKNDERHQLRLDAGEVVDGIKTVYLQVNSQASNKTLKEWVGKNGTHENLAADSIDMNTPEQEQEKAFDEMMTRMKSKAKDKLK